MLQTSMYCVECVCGQHLETDAAELDCPACGRKLRIEWDAEARATVQILEPKAIPAAA
jgi:predicted RNA-binding Zn-ribbon protein involved in translation (DUF1610 family)